jgi:dTDP-4-dehydrorhamnose 3,5-epimerase
VKFTETPLKGAFIIEPERIEDERGFFARTFCRREFNTHSLNPDLLQCSVSFNRKCGTLRGMHFQVTPHAETKLVRCTRGGVYDVILDLRPQSPTFKNWVAVHLSAENHLMAYIPEGFAHGFQTLQDETEVSYYISEFYSREYERGVRWNDPTFGIRWPARPRVISDKDAGHPDFAP